MGKIIYYGMRCVFWELNVIWVNLSLGMVLNLFRIKNKGFCLYIINICL